MKPAKTMRSGLCEFTMLLSSISQSCLLEPGFRLRNVLRARTWVGIGGSQRLALSNPNTFDLFDITALTFTEGGKWR